jgi:hypothetical protein
MATKSSPVDYSKINPDKDDPLYSRNYGPRCDTGGYNEVTKGWPMHPDGKPWKKCCTDEKADIIGTYCSCAATRGCFNRSDVDCSIFPFVCCHRKDGEYLRVCAGWHAKFGKKWNNETRELQADTGRKKRVVKTKTVA